MYPPISNYPTILLHRSTTRPKEYHQAGRCTFQTIARVLVKLIPRIRSPIVSHPTILLDHSTTRSEEYHQAGRCTFQTIARVPATARPTSLECWPKYYRAKRTASNEMPADETLRRSGCNGADNSRDFTTLGGPPLSRACLPVTPAQIVRRRRADVSRCGRLVGKSYERRP